MRVAISALSVKPDRTGGGETVLRNLVRHLPLADPTAEYLVFVNRENQALFAGEGVGICLEVVPGWVRSPASRVGYELLVLPEVVRRRGIDLFFAVNQVVSPLLPCPAVAFVQNLLYYHYREFFRFGGPRLRVWAGMEARNLYFSLLQGASVRRAVHTIAVSETARREVAQREGVPLARITAVPLAVSTDTGPLPVGEQGAPGELGLWAGKTFFLMVGALSPYKNIDLALAGLARLKQENPTQEIELVVLGLNVHGYGRHLRQIAVRLGIADAVHFPGYVPHAKLCHWYRQARALLLLSACEAFPLPPLEAMACGTPVIASNLSSVPEVVGTGGVVIDPYNTTQLAGVMRRMIEDERFREEQTAAGRRWVGQYSWEQTAGRIAQLLHACRDRLAASP